MDEKILGVEDKVEEMDNSVKKKSVKSKNIQAQNIQEIWDTMKRLNLRITERRINPGQRHRNCFQ